MALREQELTRQIIGAAIDVHRALGPGLLESAYQVCLAHELGLRSIPFEREKPLPLTYQGVELDCGYRIDFLIDQKVVLELKAVDHVLPIHKAQLLTYLRQSGARVGLIINFNVPVLRDGIVRRVL